MSSPAARISLGILASIQTRLPSLREPAVSNMARRSPTMASMKSKASRFWKGRYWSLTMPRTAWVSVRTLATQPLQGRKSPWGSLAEMGKLFDVPVQGGQANGLFAGLGFADDGAQAMPCRLAADEDSCSARTLIDLVRHDE